MRPQSAILVTAIVAFAGGLFVATPRRGARPELLVGKPTVPRS